MDYNNKPLNLLGFMTAEVKVGRKTIKTARIVITRDGKRSLIGRDWLNQLNFRVGETNGNSEYSNNIQNISERQDMEKLKEKFPKLFSRQGKIKGHKIKCEFEKEAINTQQKGRRDRQAAERKPNSQSGEDQRRSLYPTGVSGSQKRQNRQNCIRCQVPE